MTAREIVRSRANPAFQRLQERKRRARKDGLVLLEGPKLVEEAIAAGVRVVEAAFSQRAADAGPSRGLLRELIDRGARVRLFSDTLLGSLAEVETTQGIVALAEPAAFDEADVFAGTPLVLGCCEIQNPGNLGALLRSAEGAGATGAVLSAGCADPHSWKALRGSMGSAFRLPLVRGIPMQGMLGFLKQRGVRVIAADVKAARRYDEVDWRAPLALLLGSEGAGLADAVLRAADERVGIPLRRPVDSLNVGVAAGVLLFEAARQRRPHGA